MYAKAFMYLQLVPNNHFRELWNMSSILWRLPGRLRLCARSLPAPLSSRPLSSSPPPTPPPATVTHLAGEREFRLVADGGQEAVLRYRQAGPGRVELYTTQVPASLAGKGVAKLLADAAFDWAVSEEQKLELSCWYLTGYLQRHPREDVLALLR